MLGANYTLLTDYRVAQYADQYRRATRGLFRCDTFVNVMLRQGQRYVEPWTKAQSLWSDRVDTLFKPPLLPTTVFDKLKSFNWEPPMKTSSLILLASMALLSDAVNAQGAQGAQSAQVAQSAQAALQAYSAAGSTEARISAIEKLRITPPAPTAANIALLRARLGGPAAVQEKVGLISVLGDLYRDTRDQGARGQIGADLKKHAFSPQRNIAMASIYAISRGPNTFEDLLAVLEHGRKTDVLSADAYAGELAHNLHFVPQDRQAGLIKQIVGQKSAYGAAVLAMYLNDPPMISKMSPDSVAALQSFLRTTEPQFPMSIGDYDYTIGIRYESWLHAYANLHERQRAGGYRATVFEQLNAQNIDPRKIIAFLSSPKAQAFMQAVGQRAPFEKSFARATTYAESFPNNQNIAPLYDRAAAWLAALK